MTGVPRTISPNADEVAKPPRRCLVIANLVHASPRVPGLFGYASEFAWTATIVTPEGTSDDERVRTPPEFSETVRVIEAPGRGDVFWLMRAFLRSSRSKASNRGAPRSVSVSAKLGGSDRLARWIDRVRHFAHLFLAYPDSERTWIRPLRKAALRAAAAAPYDVIVSSSPHPSVHIVAKRLHRRLDIPWVADFRDPWSHNHNYPYGRLRHRLDTRRERKTIAGATAITAATPGVAAVVGYVHQRPVHVVINGFLRSSDRDPTRRDAGGAGDRRLVIAYTGSIYAGQQDLGPLVTALRQMVADDPAAAEEIRLRFVGDRARWVEPQLQKAGLGAMIEFVGEVSAAEVDSIQQEAHVLLLLGWIGGERATPLPTKLFEYLGMAREILFVGPSQDSLAARIVTDTGAGTIVQTQREVREVLERYLTEFRGQGDVNYRGRPDLIAGFEFRGRSREFFEFLDSVHTDRRDAAAGGEVAEVGDVTRATTDAPVDELRDVERAGRPVRRVRG